MLMLSQSHPRTPGIPWPFLLLFTSLYRRERHISPFDFLVFLDYIKRLRYCEYLGKYFCQCCHENAQMVIPSRVLRKWDFSKYYVSNFSKDLLIKIWNDPLFNVQDINSALYRKVKLLNQVWVRPVKKVTS